MMGLPIPEELGKLGMHTHYEHPATIIHSCCEYAVSITYEHYEHPACTIHGSCKYAASIIICSEPIACAFRFQIYACANTACTQMYACNTHAARTACMLNTRSAHGASFFSACSMFAIFIRVAYIV